MDDNDPPTLEVLGTPRFYKWVKKARLVPAAKALVERLRLNPTEGDAIPRSGGVRKVRMAGSGRGKRGGFRVVYSILIESTLLLLLDGYSKSDKEDLTADELANLVKTATEVEQQIRAERAANTDSEGG